MPTLNYREAGAGFPVVLIHGFCETNEIWSEFIPYLSKHSHVLVPDLPGFGKSPVTGSKVISLEGIASTINDWLTELDISESIMIGHSLGGYITLAFAEKYPKKLRAFGLFHSTSYADTEEKKESRNKAIKFVRMNGVKPFVETLIPSLFYRANHKELQNDIDKTLFIAKQTPKHTVISYSQAMRDRPERTKVLKSFNGPILFIAGEEDNVIPLKDSKEQAILPKYPFPYFLKDTGHMGMFEKKEQVNEMVEDFIAQAKEYKNG